MIPSLSTGVNRPVSGLAGVRALAGTGCGCGKPVGGIIDTVTSPLFVFVASTALVAVYIIAREAIR